MNQEENSFKKKNIFRLISNMFNDEEKRLLCKNCGFISKKGIAIRSKAKLNLIIESDEESERQIEYYIHNNYTEYNIFTLESAFNESLDMIISSYGLDIDDERIAEKLELRAKEVLYYASICKQKTKE